MAEEPTERQKSGLLDTVKGKVKEVAGSVLGDEDLERQGELEQDRVAKAKDAERLSAEADQRSEQVELEAAQSANAVERQRLATEAAAADREAAVERERSAAEADVERTFAAREAVLDRQADLEEAAVDRQEDAAARANAHDAAEADRVARLAEQERASAAALDALSDDRS